LPGGSLLITGGDPSGREVVKIDTLREYAVSSQPLMHIGRYRHAAVYPSQYLYVLAGYINSWYYKECERYSCAESRWEVLPSLPVAGDSMSVVEVENSVYALGGRNDEGALDTVQKLSLDSLTWELMELKLPHAAKGLTLFKKDTKVYLVIKKTLHSFTPLQVKPIKILPQSIYFPYSCHSRCTLYYHNDRRIKSLALGI
jgi:hypothetical protein